MKYIEKVAVSKIPKINGSVVDTFNVEDKTTNAPSIRAVEEKLAKGHGYYNNFRTSDLAVTTETATGIKVNLDTMGGNLLILASLPIKMSSTSGYVRVYIDGVNKGNIGTTSVQSDKIIHSFSKIFTGIEKGSHEVELYVLPDPYTANENTILTIQRYITQCLTVIEL